MTPLKKEYVDSCPVEGGFHMRGVEMTRIEVFVDAAFAFAVTMLVISFDSIPTNFPEMVLAIKAIPAFVAAVVQLVWIWHTHNIWSKRFGLDTTYTVVLSTALLIVMLIYVYPMRIMAQGMFSWLSNGYLQSGFVIASFDELTKLFVFLGIGFIAVSIVFVLMYRYASNMKDQLGLTPGELHTSQTVTYMWMGAAMIGLLSIVLALTLPPAYVPFSGFAYSLLGIWTPYLRVKRSRSNPAQLSE